MATSALGKRFLAVKDRAEFAGLLGVTEARLVWHAWRSPSDKRYREFRVHKKAGGVRMIEAPSPGLKELQRLINELLQAAYQPRRCVTGFVARRGIVSNAEKHVAQRWVLNVDMADFFPTIDFGRVRGMLLKRPYSLPGRVATVIAQLCCHGGHLPQGAPTSPALANMICARMDSELSRFTKEHRVVYSRYADDITFSTSAPNFPKTVAITEIPWLGGSVEVAP